MGERIGHFGLFHSLKTQMVFGTMLLLGITIGSISYSLIIHEKMILKNEIERSVALQGENIAMASSKALPAHQSPLKTDGVSSAIRPSSRRPRSLIFSSRRI